jgi:hypothetical protein
LSWAWQDCATVAKCHDEFAFAFENPYAAWQDTDFPCGVNRGRASNGLFVLNHFISDPLPDREAAARVNRGAPLWAHAVRCGARASWGACPTS